MSYKTILVHVDDDRNADTRIALAARLAMAEQAHLIGTALTGVSRFLHDTVATEVGSPDITPYLDILRQRAQRALKPFDDIVQRIGLPSVEKRLTDDEAAGGLSVQARYCDLVVLGQYDPDVNTAPVYANLAEYVVMNSGCPALIVPHTGVFNSIGERVLIAWNGSIEAAKAIRNALPLLRRAKIVEVAVFNPKTGVDGLGDQPGADIALYLARHGIKVDVMQEKTDTDVGTALLSLAAGLHSDLLVMGCYGHSRFREILLGGATRSILHSMTVPVMMSH
jgi:nucleotide-binding universal stress UspA family protein